METIEALTAPVSEDQPCGIYYEQDQNCYVDYKEIENAASGEEERVMGDSQILAQEPNWNEICNQSIEFFEKSKDLTIACYLTLGWLKKNKLIGLTRGLELIESLIVNYWEEVHPQLVIDGDYDPDYRINALNQLPSEQLLTALMEIDLVSSRQLGSFCYRKLLIAQGEIELVEGDGNRPPNLAEIEHAFLATDQDLLLDNANDIESALKLVENIESKITDSIDSNHYLKWEALKKTLNGMHAFYQQGMTKLPVGNSVDEVAEPSEAETEIGPVKLQTIAGTIQSRADVVRTIDMICDFYQSNEPSSPIPLLLQRVQRLVDKDFLTILQDIAPDGVSQAALVAGVEAE